MAVMTLTGIFLVLIAAVCHAIWNFYVKRINGGPELIWLFSLVAVILYFPMAAWILLVEKPTFSAMALLFIVGSTILHLGYFVLLQTGYRKGDLSLVYPIARSTGPMLSAAFAVFLLGDVLTLQMGIGAFVIIFGVFMLTGGIKSGAKHVNASLMFGVGAGLFIGSYTAWDAYAVSMLLIPPFLLDYMSNIGRLIFLAPVAYHKRAAMRDQWKNHKFGVIIIAIFNPLAYILVLYAFTFTPVTFVAPLREVSVLLTVLAGSLLLNEGHLKRRLSWAAVILVGMVTLVSAPI